MNILEFAIEHPVKLQITGKFEAPSEEWIHEDFPLDDYELFVVTEGILYITYRNKNYTVCSGEFLLLPPSLPPHNRRKGFRPSGCSFYWMHFSADHDVRMQSIPNEQHEDYPYHVCANMLAIPVNGKVPFTEKLIVLMKQLQDSVKSEYTETMLNYMSTTILCELHSQLYQYSKPAEPVKRSQKQMYYDIIDFVKLNTFTNLKVSDVAAHFGYNEKYLSHLFSNIAGIPLKQFILTNKMNKANFLLTDTNKSILDIALSLGFSDSHNFSKAYKKISGLTPSEYRNAFSKRLLFHS